MVSVTFFIISAVWAGCMAILMKQYTSSPATPKVVEKYRDPIFLNTQKIQCDDYPRANGSIYGQYSHLMSGYPYYDKAY